MNIIVAVDKNWGIGRDGRLLFNIPEDMKFFRNTTYDKVVVMGHSTYKSIPNAPLKNRINIVLSRKIKEIHGAIVFDSLDNCLKHLKQYNTQDIFIIGGQSVYKQLLAYCKYAYVTKVNREADSDTYFPNLDENKNWRAANIIADSPNNDFTIYRYENTECILDF